jgi:hypothetical protein
MTLAQKEAEQRAILKELWDEKQLLQVRCLSPALCTQGVGGHVKRQAAPSSVRE